MGGLKSILLTAVFFGLAALLSCRDNDDDEDEKGARSSGAAATEQPAPLQAAGKLLIYNFDSDAAGQMPAKFHSARTGQGSESTWG